MNTAVRSRRRVQVDNMVTDAMRAKARELYAANKAKNTATREETRLQKELNQLMAAASEAKPLAFTEVVGEKTLDVKYAEGTKETVDVNKLFKLVDEATFLKAVGATRKSVSENCGDNVEAACVSVAPSDTWKASVKARK